MLLSLFFLLCPAAKTARPDFNNAFAAAQSQYSVRCINARQGYGTAFAAEQSQTQTTTPVYAMIGEGAELFSAAGVKITTLPATYFVLVIEETATDFHVTYLDIEGFVDKNAVSAVDFEPVTKYAQPLFFADNDTHSVNIRSLPSRSGEILATVPDGGSGIYYGTTTGDALVGDINEWYYVRFGEGQIRGYVYAPQIRAASLADNIIEAVPKPDDEDEKIIGASVKDGIFIAALCIPAVIIMFIVFRGGGERKPRHMQ